MKNDLFSYDLLKTRKQKALKTFHKADYLAKDMEKILSARLGEVTTVPKKILVLGCPGQVIQSRLKAGSYDVFDPLVRDDLQGAYLPFEAASYDLIIEGFIFHWLNDPLRYLAEVNRLLSPGGLYLSGFLGGATLGELRQALIKTDIELYEGACARISPMIKPEAATRLLQTAGFRDPIVDHEEVEVPYPDLKTFFRDLRFMGESNALKAQGAVVVSKRYFECAEKNYQSLFPKRDNHLITTFDFVFMTGWRSL